MIWHFGFVLLPLTFAGQGPEEPAVRYQAALELYRSRQLESAARVFESLTAQVSPVGPLARFGLANAWVLQSTRPGISPQGANALLEEAIESYRMVLDGMIPEELNRRDVEHNLELAKRFLRWPGEGSDRTRPSRSSATSKQLADATQNADPANSDRDLPATLVSDEPPKTAKDEGEVFHPLAGLPWIEETPKTPEQAEKDLARNLDRIRREKANRLTFPLLRPRSGDY